MPPPDLAFFVAREREVWDALVRGDAVADRALLAEEFVGLYPDGFGDAHAHAAQLADGPTVATYRIADERLVPLGPDHVVLCYLATYRRPGNDQGEQMYVSSIWARRDDRWLNVFSQDTPLGDPVV